MDPGHGGCDHGAVRGDISEKDITLDVSKRVRELLEKKGYEVFMTREIDETLSLQDRVEISENLVPDMFVSIHVNSSNSDAPNGLETHYYKDNSLLLAKTLHASMLNHVQANNRGLFKSKFYVINHTTAPAILLEIGFMSNPIERVQLITDFRKQATAKAIAEGIDDYFKKY
jgi:N-acetylmuramoyl-L-alanine amidase